MDKKKAKKSSAAGTKDTKPDRSNRRGTLIWTGVCIALSFWMFCLGVLVGRGTAPVQFDTRKLHHELSKRKKAAMEQTQREYHADSRSANAGTEIEFHEKLRTAVDDIQPTAPEGAMTSETRPKASAESIPKKRKGDAFKKNKPLAESWTVQVAATKNQADADRIVARLKQANFVAYRHTVTLAESGTWHRVRVGRYRTKAAADAVIHELTHAMAGKGYSPISVGTEKD